MPNPLLPPFSNLIPLIPVADHAVRVSAKFWQPHLQAYNLQHHLAAIFNNNPTADLTRSRLLGHPYVNQEQKCLEIFMWGYPTGGRGNLNAMYFNNLTAITQHASTARTWPVYYQTLHALGGLGVSTITKLAYFHGHQFGGCPALILDSRLVKVLADGHWRGLTMLNLRYQNAVQHYQDYLDLLSGVATQLGCPPDHIEFLLFSWGDSFC